MKLRSNQPETAGNQTAFALSASRLPEVGTTIFTTMSALAARTGAINLGQGFPDFASDPALHAAVSEAMRAEKNQYAPMPGTIALRTAIGKKMAALYGTDYDINSEITVTAGATQAILNVVLCATSPGDEVLIIEPTYDSYLPAITMAGAHAVQVAMLLNDDRSRGYCIDWDRVSAAVTAKTRLIIVNSPHNPTGYVMTASDMDSLAAIVHGTDIAILADEVYEHMVFDGRRHLSVAGDARLAPRAFVVSSFGKTYHVTGWKIGYVAAPAALTAEFRKVHQYTVFSVNTPMQDGLAAYMDDPQPYLQLSAYYQKKRDLFRSGLQQVNPQLRLLPCDGTYFQSVDFRQISSLDEAAFAQWLIEEIGVAAIPVSAFYRQPEDHGIIRFCFAKEDRTLLAALDKLRTL